MLEVFVDDTITLKLRTYIELSGYDAWQIKYRNPSGIFGYWGATVDPADSTILQADIELDEDGLWIVQAFVTTVAGARLHGRWAEIKAHDFIPLTPAPTTLTPTTV